MKAGLSMTCLGLISVPALATGNDRGEDESGKMNILCIVCEDISPYIGCYGDPYAKTPHLDRLASESVIYTGMHTTVGVSAPSRFALITGLYPSSCGANYMRTLGDSPEYMPDGIPPYEVVTPSGVKCYSEFMRAAGYYCTNGPKTDYQFLAPLSAWDECGGTDTHWKNRPDGMPFFSIFNLGVTHESQIWGRTDMPLAVNPDSLHVPPYLPDIPEVRHDLAVMYSNIHEMDRQVGLLIKEVADAGLLDNTIIIWYSDNGGPMQRSKREIYLTGTNVPFMIRYPDGHGAGTIEDRLCMFPDIPATILSLAGIRPPGYMHGRAFSGKYERPARKYVYSARDRMDDRTDKQGGIFDGRYHLIRNYMPERADFLDCTYQDNIPSLQKMKDLYASGLLSADQSVWFNAPRPAEEFYDTETDPYELHNLIDNPGYRDIIKNLRHEYGKWIKKYNRTWFIPEKETYLQFCPDGRQQATATPEIKIRKGRAHVICDTESASIVYRIVSADRKENCERWRLYTGPVDLPEGDTIEAMAVRIGYRESPAVSATYCD